MRKETKKKVIYSASAIALLASQASQAPVFAEDNINKDDVISESRHTSDKNTLKIFNHDAILDFKEAEAYSSTYATSGGGYQGSMEHVKEKISQGAVNVQSVGKYRTQEGAESEDNKAHLAWDVQWSPMYSKGKKNNELWIMVPKFVQDVSITMTDVSGYDHDLSLIHI